MIVTLPPLIQNLYVYQGASFLVSVPIPSGYSTETFTSYASSMRSSYYSNSVISTINVTSANSNLINLSLTANTTTTLLPNTYVYDVFGTDANNNIFALVRGNIFVVPGVTFPSSPVTANAVFTPGSYSDNNVPTVIY